MGTRAHSSLWLSLVISLGLGLAAGCNWDSNGSTDGFSAGSGGSSGSGGGSGNTGNASNTGNTGNTGGSLSTVPALSSPGPDARGLSLEPLLVWRDWPGIGNLSFDVQVATDTGFVALVHDQSGLSGLSFRATGLSASSTYHWRVRSRHGGTLSPWSARRSFATGAATAPRPVIYQLVVRHFGNTTGANQTDGDIATNGVGKFADIDERALERLRALGITHVWLTGIPQQATATDYSAYGQPADDPDILKGRAGSFYAVKDYFDTCPDYATDPAARMSELGALIGRIHGAGMKVLIDLVPNHVARSYDSDLQPSSNFGSNDDQSLFFDTGNNFFYLAGGQPLVLPSTSWTFPGMNGGFAPENGQPGATARVTGNNSITHTPSAFDWYETVKLNYGYDFSTGTASYTPIPSTWTLVDQIIAYWQNLGVDGFRCDFAHYVPLEFWEWAIANAKARAACFFVAEAYEGTGDAVPGFSLQALCEKGFDAVYDDGTYDSLKRIYSGTGDKNTLDATLGGVNDYMRSRLLRYLENHDERRIASPVVSGGSPDDSGFGSIAAGPHLAPIAYLVGSGPLLVYNGQTVGATGAGTEGYDGDNGRTSIFDYWRIPALSAWVNNGAFDGGQLSDAQREGHEYYRRILALAQHPLVLAERYYGLDFANNGDPDYPGGLYTFVRYAPGGGELLLVVANWALTGSSGKVRVTQDLAEVLAGLPLNVQVSRIFDETGDNAMVPVASLSRDALINDGFPVDVPNQATRVYLIAAP